jgi:hypothetical protein
MNISEDVKGVRAFLGTAGYYRSFIKNYADKAAPLNQLLRGGVKFEWTPERREAFEILKTALMSEPVLSYATRYDPFILDTDCSNFALGGVLQQLQKGKEKVIAYCSKTLSETQSHYCTTKRELFAVKYSIFYFKHFLKGQKNFTVRTDHSALRWLRGYKEGDDTLIRWNYELQGYNFDILHRAGKDHTNCDGLSRITVRCPRDDCPECRQLRGRPLPGRKLRKGQKEDEESDGDEGDSDFDYCVMPKEVVRMESHQECLGTDAEVDSCSPPVGSVKTSRPPLVSERGDGAWGGGDGSLPWS